MSTGPAVVFRGIADVVIEEISIPTPGPGELLIRTRKSLISTGTELTLLSGEFPPESTWAQFCGFPMHVGYSNIAEVVATGDEVDEAWLGRRVGTYTPHISYALTTPEAVRPVPEGVDDDAATFFTLAEIVMNGIRRSQLQWGESVVIYGAGLLGQLAARFCRLCGARPVVVVDVAHSRLQCLPQDPAIIPVNSRQQTPAEVVAQVTRDRMADVVFELTGIGELIPEQFSSLRRQGRMVILSAPRGRTNFDFHDLCNWPSYTIIGAHNSSTPQIETPGAPWTWKRHAELFFDILQAQEMDLAPLVSHLEPAARAPELYQMLLADRSQAMGVILDWTAEH